MANSFSRPFSLFITFFIVCNFILLSTYDLVIMPVITFFKMWTIQSFGWEGWGDFNFGFEGKWVNKKEECVKKCVNNILNVDRPTIV